MTPPSTRQKLEDILKSLQFRAHNRLGHYGRSTKEREAALSALLKVMREEVVPKGRPFDPGHFICRKEMLDRLNEIEGGKL